MNNSPSLNEVADLNFIIPDLQYSSILHIPFYTRLLHHFYSYFGKINASISAPSFLGYLYYVIIIVQTFLPAFLIDCEDLWPRGSLMSMILFVLGYVYQGPHMAIKSSRVLMSIIVSIIFIILMIILIIRTEHFHKTGRVSSIEIKFMYYMFKYIMPLFCPHLMAGLPISFDQIVNQNKIDYNLFQIILSILAYGFYLYLFYVVVSPRVLLEDTPSHDWYPLLSFLTIANTTLLAVVSGAAGCVEGKSRAGCSIWIVIQSILIGFLFFSSNSIIKMIITVVSSATCFSSAFTSIFLTADIFLSKPLSPEILLIISVIAYIVLIVAFKIFKQMKVNAKMQFFDSLIDAGHFSIEIFDSTYKRPFNFLNDILSVIELWHPVIINFELFEHAVSKWPTNFSVLILYSRILAIFPDKNQQMMAVATKIANLTNRKIKTPYLYQFRHLARTRQTSMTPSFQAKMLQINSKTEVINDLLKRFWENILQKNTVNFWSDSDRVFHHADDLDSLYAQLLDDYPNNYQLLKSYSQFVSKVKHNHNEKKEMNKKLVILKKNGTVKSNFGLEIALQVFPVLNNYVQLAENEMINGDQNSIKTDANLGDANNINDEEMNEINNEQDQTNEETNDQLECSVEELIKHSKIGSIWITCAIILIITVVIIVVFYLFYDYFMSKFVNNQQNAIDFSLEIDLFCNELNFFLINLNILPLVFEDQIESPISILNRTEFTEKVAPELFSLGLIPEFSLSTESMIDLLSKLKDRFTKVIESLSLLNKNDPFVQKLNYIFYQDTTFGATVRDMTNNLLSLGLKILKLTNPKEFFNKDGLFSSFTTNTYMAFQVYTTMVSLTHESSSNYDTYFNRLNELMIIVILITILLLTLPYLIQLYVLIIQSESIAESFALFPNTEIRSIINEFGKSTTTSSSKIEEDTTQVASLNNIRRTNRSNGIITILTFLSSFIIILICSLIIYFIAKDFTDKAVPISEEAYTLTKPFSALSYSFIQVIRFYMLTHDGNPKHIINLDENLYSHSGDNLSQIIDISLRMLFVAYEQFSTGMWNENGGMNIFNKRNNISFDYFTDAFAFDDQDVSPSKSFFEELATDIFTESVGHICDFLWYYLIHGSESLKLGMNKAIFFLSNDFHQMPSIIYWFSNFSDVNRTQIYFKMVEEDIFDKIDSFKTIPKVCFYIVIVWQIVSCFVMIMFLVYRNKKIKKALTFYQFIKPELLLQNQKALSLIESGKQIIEESDVNNQTADFIISKINQGMVITDKKLIITSFNESFIKKCQLNDQIITGESLTEIFSDDNQDKSWTSFIQHTEDSIQGKFKSQFTDYFSVILKNGQTCHFSCTATCLTPLGIPNASNISHISKVAFLFDDNTENFMREQLISREKKHLNDMLTNVMPSRIVHSFVNSGECISFIVQSVSIGAVGIKTDKKFDQNTADEFIFYKEIFNRFDQELNEFELLTKSNTFSHTYTFIGGLFSEINKPEKHAEESIKYSLKLLSILPELSDKYGVEIHLIIGVHTGGPIVAGVLSFEKPTFQIIGTVGDLANQIKYKGVPDQICITRAVYELIFSASFNVQEQGDTKIRGGKVIPTYLVKP